MIINSLLTDIITVMEWSGRRTGQDTGSGVSQKARPQQADGKEVLLYSSRQFSAPPKSFFFFSVALRPRKRYGLLGTGTGGKGTKEWRLDHGYRPKKTGETVDRRQNNGCVKAVSRRHCPATCALRNCCFNCCAWTESQRQCPLHCCWRTTWTTRSEISPNFRSPAPPPYSWSLLG